MNLIGMFSSFFWGIAVIADLRYDVHAQLAFEFYKSQRKILHTVKIEIILDVVTYVAIKNSVGMVVRHQLLSQNVFI